MAQKVVQISRRLLDQTVARVAYKLTSAVEREKPFSLKEISQRNQIPDYRLSRFVRAAQFVGAFNSEDGERFLYKEVPIDTSGPLLIETLMRRASEGPLELEARVSSRLIDATFGLGMCGFSALMLFRGPV